MPSPRPCLSAEDVYHFVEEQCFPDRTDGRVGVELEWLVVDADGRRAPLAATMAAADRCHLTGGSSVTYEPGGQLELSSLPETTWDRTCAALTTDLLEVTAALAADGLRLVGTGLDPTHHPCRVVDSPRYRAMEAFFDSGGEEIPGAGRTMMANTAAVQINLDVGRRAGHAARWELAHAIGPVLLAAFANSPVQEGKPSGWRSTRWAAWQAIDRTRTRPALGAASGTAGPVRDWADFALGARVLLVRQGDRSLPVVDDLTFAGWMAAGHESGWPTVEDFRYHLTTLFPPVRARGWLELRMVDALADPWWRSAVAVSTTLLEDPEAAEGAALAAAPCAGRWVDAARHGLTHPVLAAGARACFELALEALERGGADPSAVAATAEYAERYVLRGRCPADDTLDALVRT
jgi:glutamate--cysteine ligase